MRSTSFCRCVAAAATAAGGSASLSSSAAAAPYDERVQRFVRFMRASGATLDGVDARPTEAAGKGLFAAHAVGEGTALLSVPLHRMGVSAERLLEVSATLRDLQAPSLDEVTHLMTSRSIQDPVLYQQMHLALLLAAERMNPSSPLTPYFEVLPHPALDDAAVIARHKDVVDPMALVEWDDYQKEFLSVLHILLRRWGAKAPPIQLAYWAFRTVLCRMHMLPAHGTAPEDVGSTLSYTALSTVDQANRQHKWIQRLRAVVGSVLGNPTAGERYPLVPTLVPLLDMAGHVSSSNVQVEIGTKAGVGSVVELRTVRPIEKGEEIGLRYNSSQSPAFLLYRFGFIPQ